jgi:hypothetical protein
MARRRKNALPDDAEESVLEAGAEPEVPEEGTKIGKRRGRRPKAKWDGPLKVEEVQAAFYHAFVALGKLFGSTATWEMEEFSTLAEGFVNVANRLPFLRAIVLITSPLAVLGELFAKVQKLQKGIRRPHAGEGQVAA